MARALIALLLVVGIAGCGGDGAAPVKPPSPDSADPALARAPAGAGETLIRGDLTPASHGPYDLDGRYRVAFEQFAPEDPDVDFRQQTAFVLTLDRREGIPGKDSIRVFRTARRTGRKVIEAHGRYLRRRVVRRLPLRDPDHAAERVASGGMPDDRAALAAEAFLYGFPLVFNLQQVGRVTREGFGVLPPAPFNHWAHATKLAGPEDTFVSVNNDTVYSISALDAGAGPIRLRVPDSAGRYYVLQFVDAWTNNFAYVGHRATGTGAGTFLLVPPAWEGEADEPVIRLPTDVAMIVGRWAVDGEADLPAVAALQEQLALEPAGDAAGIPDPAPVSDELIFFEELRAWLQAFPPAERDLAYQERFAPLGLLEAESPYLDPDPELAAALRDGVTEGRRQLEAAVAHGGAEPVNGWQPMYHVFDYNLDFFELGTLDDPAWKAAGDEHGALPPPRGRGARRAVGQPRLRGRLRAGLRRRRRRAARRHAALRPALRDAAAGRRLLVGDDVRPARVLPRRQPGGPLLDRRPDARARHRRRTAR